ncbi:hypothetical protein BHE74_00017548 [Ensete ventricosum]|nr:hypothetical protein BHE74_00017548 [Ensete ventricosum]
MQGSPYRSIPAYRDLAGRVRPYRMIRVTNCGIARYRAVRILMAFELYGMLAGNVSPMTGENIRPAYGGDEEAFLKKIVTPIYEIIAKVLRSVDCFHLGWPMRADADFFCSPQNSRDERNELKGVQGFQFQCVTLCVSIDTEAYRPVSSQISIVLEAYNSVCPSMKILKFFFCSFPLRASRSKWQPRLFVGRGMHEGPFSLFM